MMRRGFFRAARGVPLAVVATGAVGAVDTQRRGAVAEDAARAFESDLSLVRDSVRAALRGRGADAPAARSRRSAA
jgi:hypothetical protein